MHFCEPPSFAFYSYANTQAKREEIVKENPGTSFGEIGKLIGAAWREMSDKEKEPFVALAAQDKLRADRDKAAAKAKLAAAEESA